MDRLLQSGKKPLPAGESFRWPLIPRTCKERRGMTMKRRNNPSHGIKDALLPDESPHDDLYEKVVPIWWEAPHDDSDWDVVERWSCGFSAGFERGLIMAMLKPEWAQGFYHRLREHYLT